VSRKTFDGITNAIENSLSNEDYLQAVYAKSVPDVILSSEAAKNLSFQSKFQFKIRDSSLPMVAHNDQKKQFVYKP